MFSVLPKEHLIVRLLRRGFSYGSVGIATYLLDLSILFLLTTFSDTPQESAIAIGFLVGISTNYLICYRFVYRGTRRNILLGYLIFALLAIGGMAVIVPTVTLLVGTFGLNLFVARTIAAAIVGTFNFLFNTFLNFRLI